jgi:hypothetical protein
MPQPEKDTGGELCLPVRLRGDNLVHERKEPVRIILNFHVNVKFDVLVLGLNLADVVSEQSMERIRRTFIRRSRVSMKVGIGCLGSLTVLTCSIPSWPYQTRSLMWPIPGWSAMFSHYQPGQYLLNRWYAIILLNAISRRHMTMDDGNIPGSWNMTTMLSIEQCTSASMVTAVKGYVPILEKYRSRCLLLHPGWQLQSLRACSPGTAQMPPEQCQYKREVMDLCDAHAAMTPAV